MGYMVNSDINYQLQIHEYKPGKENKKKNRAAKWTAHNLKFKTKVVKWGKIVYYYARNTT